MNKEKYCETNGNRNKRQQCGRQTKSQKSQGNRGKETGKPGNTGQGGTKAMKLVQWNQQRGRSLGWKRSLNGKCIAPLNGHVHPLSQEESRSWVLCDLVKAPSNRPQQIRRTRTPSTHSLNSKRYENMCVLQAAVSQHLMVLCH